MISWPYKLSMMFYMTTDQMSYAHEFGPKKVNHQHNLEGSSNLERKNFQCHGKHTPTNKLSKRTCPIKKGQCNIRNSKELYPQK